MRWTERASKVQIGDTVAYSKAFLQSTGQYTGLVTFACGKVTGLKLVGSRMLAEVEWDCEDCASRVNVDNLALVTQRGIIDRDRAMPQRLQQKRTKGWKTPLGAIIISRPSKWGNPFKIGEDRDRSEVVRLFREWIVGDDPAAIKMRNELHELRGRDLVCYCPFPGPCHGDVLIELANR